MRTQGYMGFNIDFCEAKGLLFRRVGSVSQPCPTNLRDVGKSEDACAYMDKTMMVFGDAKKVVEDMVKAIE